MTTATVQSVSLLPVYLQTSKNAKFLSSTIDQLIQPAELERLNAYIGSTSTPTYSVGDSYIQESSKLRQEYQLTPALVTYDINNTIQSATAIDDLANEISVEGGLSNDFDRLFRSESYSYYPQIDWDKLTNYQKYYWLPTGPKLIEFDQDMLDVENLVVGQTTATLTVGSKTVSLMNGMFISFNGQGVAKEYQYREFFVEGVGTSIQLIPYDELITPESIALPGIDYFDLDRFDTYAFDNDRNMPIVPEYVTINRGSKDRNSWSRYNRWVSEDVIAVSAFANEESIKLPATARAVRPIIEFNADIQLYNFGSTAIKPIDLIDTTTKDAFLTISGPLIGTKITPNSSTTSTIRVDGIELEHGMRIVFTNDIDLNVRNKIYEINFVAVGTFVKVALLPAPDSNLVNGQSLLVTQGNTNSGTTWHFNGNDWIYAQQHTKLNQAPLFDLFDDKGISYSDNTEYQNNFYGNKIFGYSINTNNAIDPVLGIRLNYRNLNTVGSFLFENYFASSSIIISKTDLSTQSIPANNTYFKISNKFVNVWKDLINDTITINTTGCYDLPLSLTNNPLNKVLNNFTLSDLTEHAVSNKRLVANAINPISFAMMFIGKKTNSVIDAIKKSAEAYNYFKLTLINKISSTTIVSDPNGALDAVLKSLNGSRTAQSPYYLSDMLAYASEKRVLNYAVNNSSNTIYPLTSPFDPTKQSFRTVYVYLKNKLLTHGLDYKFDPIDGTVEFLTTLHAGDQIKIDDFYNTKGSFVPPTPTKLGLYPSYVPKIYIDYTYASGPVNVIQGHDGSLMVAFNDYRDAIILEYEKRVYNNLKVQYRYDLFDVNSVLPGAFRNNDYSLDEINGIIESDFIKWSGEYGIDYTTHGTFDSSNPFTWNYGSSYSKKINIPVKGSWRAVFDYFYDTDRPNTNPWEMLGFISEPDWWVSEYGSAPYTSGNAIMWEHLEAGHIAQGPTAGVNTFYARPGLSSILPVNDNGDLLDPVTIGLIDAVDAQAISNNWAIGDQGPAETAWRRSSYWPFVVQRLVALTRPADYCAMMYDPYHMHINTSGQWTYGDNEEFLQLANMPIHGENGNATSGYSVFVSEIGLQRTQNYISELRQDLQYVNFNLFHKVGGFLNKNTLQVIIDAYEPTSPAPGAILPNESYNLILNTSNPILSVGISGIIIQRVDGKFVVRGYDRNTPYFNYYTPIRNASTPKITVGGVSTQYVVWTPLGSTGNNGLTASQTTTARSAPSTVFYQTGQIVQYGSNFYRVLVSHQAEAVFDTTLYQILSDLPTTGGASVQLADNFNTDIVKVPYGTTFTTVQELFDMIIGYGMWLTDQGFIFDQFNQELGVVNDWNLSAREFLYWSTQNWADNSVISLSPFADQISFSNPDAVVDNIFNSFYDYGVNKADGTPFSKSNLFVARQNGVFTINTINTVDGIYFAQLNCIQKEHAMVFDNTDIFGDVIYDIQTGERQQRMKLVGFRTANWNGDFFSPGFVYDEALISNWKPYTNYIASNIVKYSGIYYSAKKNISNSATFDFTKWNNLGTKPSAGLIPNFDYKISQFNDFYSLDIDNFDSSQEQAAQNLIGYIPRKYLNSVFTDPISQYKFYQGYIREKGTSNAISKLSKASLATVGSSVGYREEWAFRVGQYGSFTSQKEYEVPLTGSAFKENPQIVSFVDTEPTQFNDLIKFVTPNMLTLGNDSVSVITTSSDASAFKLLNAGYVRIDDVDSTAYSQNSILDIANNDVINDGTTIWLGFTPNGSWDVLRYTYHSTSIIDVNATQPYSEITFTTNIVHGITAGQLISVVNFDSTVNGIYKVSSVPTAYTFTVPSSLSSIDFPNPPSPGILFTFESSRVSSFNNFPEDQKLYRYKNGSLIWVDSGNGKDNNGWAVYKKVLNYTNTSTSELALPVAEGFGFSISKPHGQPYALIGSPKYNDGTYSGGSGLYQSTNNSLIPLTLYQMLTPLAAPTELGYSVFYDDKKFIGSQYGLMFAGAPGAYVNSGTVRISSINNIFEERLQTWLTNPGSSTARFGSSLFVQRNTSTKLVLVGAPKDTANGVSNAGAVHAYKVFGTTATVTATYFTKLVQAIPKANSNWGSVIVGTDNANLIAIGSPDYNSSGTVSIYVNLLSITPTVKTINSPFEVSTIYSGARFGAAISLSNDQQYLAIGAPNVNNDDGSYGAVAIFAGSATNYILQQIITNPVMGSKMKFGSAISFDSDPNTLVISALGTNTTVSTIFDLETTSFDLGTTDFIEEEPQSGSVYVYNRKSPNYKFAYSEELINSIEAVTTGTDYGTSIVADGTILVGAPGISGHIVSNVYQFNQIDPTIAGWNQIRSQDDLVLPQAVQKIQLINTATNDVVNYYDYVDPLKGKILGLADQEITYKMPSDPAIYSVGTVSVNINSNANWLDDHVGELWWDVSTAKYVWYEQGDLEFRRNNWNKLFPGSTIDIYEWVSSTLLPSDWAAQADTSAGLTRGISGQPKFVDNTNVSVKQVYDPVSNSFSNVYYFWVKNKVTVPDVPNRRISAYLVSTYIADPTGSGIQHASVISSNTIMLSNLGLDLASDSISLNLTIDNLFSSIPRHTEWDLIQHGLSTSNPPLLIEKKIVDSLVGHDILGNLVPDPKLSERAKYGIGIRPQQTLFKDKSAALRNIVEYANNVLINIPISEYFIDIKRLNFKEAAPTQYIVLEDTNELALINTSTTATVTVLADDYYNNGWAVYSVSSSTYTWERIQTQSYDTTRYWSAVDWQSTDFNPYKDIAQTVDAPYLLDSVTTLPYQYVRINDISNGDYAVVQRVGGTTGITGTFGNNWKIVYYQNGTIQISDKLWNNGYGWDNEFTYNQTLFDQTPDVEIRATLDFLKNDIFINDLKIHWNNLFFIAVKYAMTEQPFLDWVFKTSFINVTNFAGGLNQPPIYKLQDSSFYEEYIKEVKPYHTQIREFRSVYNTTETAVTSITDFDHPSYWSTDKKTFVTPVVSATDVMSNPVREIDTTLVFDRISTKNQLGSLTVTDKFIGNGATTEFPLSWVAQPDKSTIVVTITGQYVLPTNYTIKYYTDSYNGYEKSYSSLLFLDTINPPDTGVTISVTYQKSNELMSAAERIQTYYTPTSGMPGASLDQLMVGAEDPRANVGGQYESKFTNTQIFDTIVNGGISYPTWNSSKLINALGIDPTELIIEGGYNFIPTQPNQALEEVVPGFTADTLGIDVYTKPSNTPPVIYDRSVYIVTTGSNYVLALPVLPTTVDNIIVTFNGQPLYYFASTQFLSPNQFTFDWQNSQMLIPVQASPGWLSYSIIGVGDIVSAGNGVIDKGVALAKGVTSTEVVSLASYKDILSVYVTVNGKEIQQGFTSTSIYYDIAPESVGNQRGSVKVYNLNANIGYGVQAWFFNSVQNKFNRVKEQLIPFATNSGVFLPVGLAYPPNDVYGPPSDQVIVELTEPSGIVKRLRPPYTSYYTVDSTATTTYPVVDLIETSSYISSSTNVNVYQNGTLLTFGTQYSIDSEIGNTGTVTLTTPINLGDTIAVETFNPTNIANTSTSSVYSYDYVIAYNSQYGKSAITLTPNYWSSIHAGATIKVVSFTDQESMLIQTKTFVGNPYRTFKLDRPVLDPQYIWVTINKPTGEKILTNRSDYQVLADHVTVLVSGAFPITTDDSVIIMSFANPTLSNKVMGYRIFNNILGQSSYSRLSGPNSTYIIQPVSFLDTTICVADASVLTPPDVLANKPGVVLIDGERIEFFQINGNVLGQLRRATYGTSPAEYLKIGTTVIDQGSYQTIPGFDTTTLVQNTFTKANLNNTYVISTATVKGGWRNSLTSSTIQCDGINFLTTSTLLAPPVDPYTGSIVNRQRVYSVSTASIHAKDQVQVFYGGTLLRKDTSYWHDTTVSYDSISPTQIIGMVPNATALTTVTNYLGNAYVCQDTKQVWVCTLNRFSTTATSLYVDSGLRMTPPDFIIINTATTATVILNTATVHVQSGTMLSIVMKHDSLGWNDPDPINTMTNTISILSSTNAIAGFLREGPAALPDVYFYGGQYDLTDDSGTTLLDEKGNPTQGY